MLCGRSGWFKKRALRFLTNQMLKQNQSLLYVFLRKWFFVIGGHDYFIAVKFLAIYLQKEKQLHNKTQLEINKKAKVFKF